MEEKKLPIGISFIAGAIAACGAVTFTNPIEVMKTRLQLQGELVSKGNTKKVYTGIFQGLNLIFKKEGLKGIQRGLFTAYLYQILLNGSRLGFYEPMRTYMNGFVTNNNNKNINIKYNNIKYDNKGINILCGAISGAIGAFLGSPFFLVKTRLQSYSPVFKIGTQSYYNGLYDGLYKIYSMEGVKGLFRGVSSAVFRTSLASSAQLPCYYYVKNLFIKYGIFNENGKKNSTLLLHFLSSTLAGFVVCIVVNPADVVMTRMYNQTGNLYKNQFDCFNKIIHIEGFKALYKGFSAQVMRMAPHTVLMLMFMEQARGFFRGYF